MRQGSEYPDSVKRAAVRRVLEGESQRAVAISMKCNRNTVAKWMELHERGELPLDVRDPVLEPVDHGPLVAPPGLPEGLADTYLDSYAEGMTHKACAQRCRIAADVVNGWHTAADAGDEVCAAWLMECNGRRRDREYELRRAIADGAPGWKGIEAQLQRIIADESSEDLPLAEQLARLLKPKEQT